MPATPPSTPLPDRPDRPTQRRRALRRLLAGLPAALLLPASGPAAARARPGRPPDHHFRLSPLLLPVAQTGPYTYARVVADLVLDKPTSRDAVNALQPRLVGAILRESWELPVGADGHVDSGAAKELKDRILRVSRDVVGRQVQDVLIVSLIVG